MARGRQEVSARLALEQAQKSAEALFESKSVAEIKKVCSCGVVHCTTCARRPAMVNTLPKPVCHFTCARSNSCLCSHESQLLQLRNKPAARGRFRRLVIHQCTCIVMNMDMVCRLSCRSGTMSMRRNSRRAVVPRWNSLAATVCMHAAGGMSACTLLRRARRPFVRYKAASGWQTNHLGGRMAWPVARLSWRHATHSL